MPNRGVSRSRDYLRIEALPRRRWDQCEELPELVQLLTEYLRAPGGQMTLWPVQAAALQDAHDCQGLFAPIAVGRGKALVSILAPEVMGAERPLLLVPAQLREQTRVKVLPEMRKHWRIHPRLEVRAYSELSLSKNADMLNDIEPDLILLDEAHSVKNPQAARTRRLRRYLREHPQTHVVALSGTMTRRSLRDYWQLLLWSLGPAQAPVPVKWTQLQDWADALDIDVLEHERPRPGALMGFCQDGESAREGFGRRLSETPGVIATGEQELGTSLRVVEWPEAAPTRVLGMVERMRKTWTTPGGEELTEAVDLWRHAREVSLGFYYRWDPPPPKEWAEARRAWKAYVREILEHAQKLDSELQIWNLCAANENLRPSCPWHAWNRLKDTFKPNVVPVWKDDFALKAATRWLRENEGICWVEHIAFGERLASFSGYPYFGAGDKASREILDAAGPIIVSQRAHSEGKNLQRYSRNLIVSPPSSGKLWEQMLGRTHRPGQEADEVTVEVAMLTPEHRAAFNKAMEEARYIQDTFGSRQKLLYADVTIPS